MLNNQSASVLPQVQLTVEANAMTNQIALFDNVNLVSVRDGKCFCTSLMIAEKFEKPHNDVLKAIRNQMAILPEDFRLGNFSQSNYVNAQGHSMPMFELTRDGFSFIVMGFTGEKAALWKIKFIEAFNAMEAQLRNSIPNFNDPAAAARAWADEYEQRIAAQAALKQEQAAHEDTLAELGRAKQYRSCLAQGTTLSRWFNIRFVDYEGDSFYGNCGKLMTMLCNGGRCGKLYTKDARFNSTTFDMAKEHVPNSRFGYINAYDVKAWEYFFKLCEQFDPHEFPYVGTFAL